MIVSRTIALTVLLDVIMVWHAYHLNPRNFLEDCIHYGKLEFWRAGLPWAAIMSCIDDVTFEFRAPTEATARWETATGCCRNSLDDAPTVSVQCSKCDTKHGVPLTQWNSRPAQGTPSQATSPIEDTHSAGFADNDFNFQCPGGVAITHDVLSAQKFRHDLDGLMWDGSSMQGLALDSNGEALCHPF